MDPARATCRTLDALLDEEADRELAFSYAA